MPVSILSAAKRLGERSGWTLTNLQMQKMSYIAHMFHLGETNEPLVDGTFQAWDLGPVHPVLYHAVKRYGADPVQPDALAHVNSVSDDHPGAKQLDAAVDQLPRNKLVAITHWKGGAWAKNYEPFSRNALIPNEDILAEYNLRLANNAERSEKASSAQS